MKRFFILVLLLNLSCKENIVYSELEIIDLSKNSFEKETIEIIKGNKAEISANLIMKDGAVNNKVIWESEDKNIVKIIGKGIIEAINVGNTNIKIYSEDDKNIFTTLKIKVLPEKETAILTSDYSFLNNKKDELKIDDLEGKIIKGSIKDTNNNLVKDVDIKINYDNKDYIFNSKDGYFEFKNIPEDYLISIEASKEGYAKRKIIEVFKKSEQNYYEINFENDYSLNNYPEINSININGRKILDTIDIEDFNTINNTISNNNFKRIDYTNISFSFSEKVDKKYFEDSFEIIGIKENKDIFFINKSKDNIKFNWSNNLNTLSINSPTKYNSDFGKTIYRIQLKNGISDLDNNISNKSIFNTTELSNKGHNGIIFSISKY